MPRPAFFTRGNSVFALLSLLLVLLGASPASASSTVQAEPCSRPEEFRHFAGVGRACRLPSGMLRVRLADGTTFETHGPDLPGALPDVSALDAPSINAAYACTTDARRIMPIYVIPTNAADRSSFYLPYIRQQFQQANDMVAATAARFGVTAALKVACDPDGQITVRVVRMSNLNSNNRDIGLVANEINAQGFRIAGQKNWMWWDGDTCGGGVAFGLGDDRPGTNNQANSATGYAIAWGRCPFTYSLHEGTHSMSGVVNSAPNSSGAGHCNDDSDVMCYNDGGPRSNLYRNNVCPSAGLDDFYDCNNDDYFHPDPPAGSFLATHWNIAGCSNLLIQRSGCDGSTPTPTFTPTRTSTQPPTQTNPILHYQFEGNANDGSGNGRNGTLVNGPAFVAGRVGQAVDLNGTNQHVSLPAGVLSGLNDFTVATWVRLDTTGAWRRVFDFGTGTAANMFLVPTAGSTIRFAITTSGSGGEQRINGASALPTGIWTHVAVTKSGSTGTLYVNGAQAGQNTGMTLSPSNLGSTTQNWIGRSQYSGDAFLDGQVDDFRLYNRALGASEIQSLAGGGATSTPTPTGTATPTRTASATGTATPTVTPTGTQTAGGLWARFPFDGNANDLSGAGRNGTLVNGPAFVAGRVGQAVDLNGSNQHVSLPAGIVNGLTNFTVATWVRLDTTGAWRRVFDFGTGTAVNMFLVPSSGSSTVRFAITTGGAGAEQQINGTPVLPTGVWKHVAITRNGNVSTLYVDGVQVGQNTNMTLGPSSLGNTTQNWIGRSQYSGDAFLDGQIDEFRIYNRALSAAEVLALFQNP